MIYYVDGIGGSDRNDGLSEKSAVKSCRSLKILPGDTVLFRRGSRFRDTLDVPGGTEGNPTRIGAFGDGNLPVFNAGIDLSSPDDWENPGKNIWKCRKKVKGDVGNLILESGAPTTYRWSLDELSCVGDFYTAITEESDKNGGVPSDLYVYCDQNPVKSFGYIEAAHYNKRRLLRLESDLEIENLRFENSGVHALQGSGDRITIRGCEFENIGGCAWSLSLKIRLGNCIEIWDHGNDLTVENCVFRNVYDSCVTHQGGKNVVAGERLICKNNVFDTYGMAAFEYRDRMPIASEFTGNTCRNAGCGFAMHGENLPRKSEIWPQPMGHHLFLWRIERGTEGGSLLVKDNDFGPAPVGAAVYSIISKEAEEQITFQNNRYDTKNPSLLVRFNGENYTVLPENMQ